MHPETPSANLAGFSHITAVMAFCATNKNLGGGAYRL